MCEVTGDVETWWGRLGSFLDASSMSFLHLITRNTLLRISDFRLCQLDTNKPLAHNLTRSALGLSVKDLALGVSRTVYSRENKAAF